MTWFYIAHLTLKIANLLSSKSWFIFWISFISDPTLFAPKQTLEEAFGSEDNEKGDPTYIPDESDLSEALVQSETERTHLQGEKDRYIKLSVFGVINAQKMKFTC